MEKIAASINYVHAQMANVITGMSQTVDMRCAYIIIIIRVAR